MLKITGFDSVRRELDELARFSKALDGPLVTLNYDPEDKASVQEAIRQMERAVDAKAAPYRSNRLVMDLAAKTKDEFRRRIRAGRPGRG